MHWPSAEEDQFLYRAVTFFDLFLEVLFLKYPIICLVARTTVNHVTRVSPSTVAPLEISMPRMCAENRGKPGCGGGGLLREPLHDPPLAVVLMGSLLSLVQNPLDRTLNHALEINPFLNLSVSFSRKLSR